MFGFGLGPKTMELFRVMRVTGTALTQKQCDELCRGGIYRLEFLGIVKQCKACKRWEVNEERFQQITGNSAKMKERTKEESHV